MKKNTAELRVQCSVVLLLHTHEFYINPDAYPPTTSVFSHFPHQRRTSWIASLGRSSPPSAPSLGSIDGQAHRPPELGMCWNHQSIRHQHRTGYEGSAIEKSALDKQHGWPVMLPTQRTHDILALALRSVSPVSMQAPLGSGLRNPTTVQSFVQSSQKLPVVPESRHKIHAPMHDDNKRSLEPCRSWCVESCSPTHQVVADELCAAR